MKKKKNKTLRIVFREDEAGLRLLQQFYKQCSNTECFGTFLRNVLHESAKASLGLEGETK